MSHSSKRNTENIPKQLSTDNSPRVDKWFLSNKHMKHVRTKATHRMFVCECERNCGQWWTLNIPLPLGESPRPTVMSCMCVSALEYSLSNDSPHDTHRCLTGLTAPPIRASPGTTHLSGPPLVSGGQQIDEVLPCCVLQEWSGMSSTLTRCAFTSQ